MSRAIANRPLAAREFRDAAAASLDADPPGLPISADKRRQLVESMAAIDEVFAKAARPRLSLRFRRAE